jgi:Zn ribbon nucleic-acid-binding protein
MDEFKVNVSLPKDKNGMIGRECPECRKYFKVKLGTGLDTSECTCPYCEYKDDSSNFATEDQIEYAKSIAVKHVVEPYLKDLENSFKDLENATRNSIISFRVETSGFDLPIKYYSEKNLETQVLCNYCGLEFSVYGIFATCPDCSKMNSMSIFKKSLEVARKRLSIIFNLKDSESDLRDAILLDALIAGVSCFDSLGKRLSNEFSLIFPSTPRNLFQNLDLLNEIMNKKKSFQLSDLVSVEEYKKMYYLFQIRHISSHNFGEIDNEFIRKTHCDPNLLGTKPIIDKNDLDTFLTTVEKLGISLRSKL